MTDERPITSQARRLRPLRERFGTSTSDLTRVALHYCLQHADNAAVLVGFTTPEQVAQNLKTIGEPLSPEDIDFVRETAGRLQQQLDAAGEVFVDEKDAPP
ncbi:aldo/keto reductase [Streptomyces sp. NPDC091292]|uniref:aldo/keto reductase n=1 Tax=Streptomyces sp. NPDC091292 TaxID=3365991 RepID=UPI00382A6640